MTGYDEAFWLIPLHLGMTLISVLVFFYGERKGSAFIQDRLGPTHVGRFGLLQPLADLLKLIQKETIIPARANKWLFLLAPFLVFASVFSGFALVPIWGAWFSDIQIEGGVLLLLGLISVEALGLLMAGYSSQSKFPWMATGRALAQMLSYEIPLGISVLCFVWISNTLDLQQIQNLQAAPVPLTALSFPWNFFPEFMGESGGLLNWNIMKYPILILLVPVFFLSIMAESNRAPFDLPEGESEIIGGFHTEYSGFLWAVFFLAEYSMMLILSMVMAYLFFGGGTSPFPSSGWFSLLSGSGPGWLLLKSWLICFSMIWIRWTLPRLRVDQLMGLSWKMLTPLSLIIFLICILLK